jgi:hypothetical protein
VREHDGHIIRALFPAVVVVQDERVIPVENAIISVR